jgi:ATP-binding cassette, subfamily C, bacterial CydC
MSLAERTRPQEERAQTRRILRLALPPARRLWVAIAFGALSGACAVALLGVSAWLITRAAEQPALMYISMAVVGVRAFALGRAFFRYLERLAGHDAAFGRLGAIRSDLFTRMVPLGPDGIGARRAADGRRDESARGGQLLARLADDVDELPDFALRVVQPLVSGGIVVLATVVAAFLFLPEAGVALLVTLGGAFVIGTLVNRWAAGASERRIAPLRAEVSGAVNDLVTNLDALIAFDGLAAARGRVCSASARLTAAMRTRAAGLGVTAGAVSALAGAATLLALAGGIPALQDGRLDGPSLAVVALLPLAVFEVFGAIPLAFGAWRRVRASAERVADTVPAIVPDGVPVDAADAGELSVTGVPDLRVKVASAHWPGSTSPVLHEVDLELRGGERVVLSGPTGAGKTAIAHVLARFLDLDGSYTIDGVDVRTVRQDDVRRVVGLVEQHPYLFDSDLRQNLLFARDTATDEELLAVLDRVGLGEWTAARGGLDTPVGERGALVSGGQAQRIALARVLLADFPVLVVDEPTANVDTAVADRIVRDILLTAADDGRTVLLISHTDVPDTLITRRLRLEAGTLVP